MRDGIARFLLYLAVVLIAAPAWAQQEVGSPSPYVVVPVGAGQLLQLDQDSANVLVADSGIADVHAVSSRMVYVYGRRIGETTLHVTGPNGVEASLVIRVQQSAAAAQAAVPPPTSPQRLNSGPVALRFLGDRLEVQGPVSNLGQAMEVEAAARGYANGIPLLDRTRLAGTQQITLRVRFAEVSRSDLNRLGINWNVLANPGSFTLGLITGTALTGLNTAETFGTASAGIVTNRVNADALINALA